jgi:hypothetical protein
VGRSGEKVTYVTVAGRSITAQAKGSSEVISAPIPASNAAFGQSYNRELVKVSRRERCDIFQATFTSGDCMYHRQAFSAAQTLQPWSLRCENCSKAVANKDAATNKALRVIGPPPL